MQVLFGSLSGSPFSINQIYVFKFVLHKQIYDETLAKFRLKIGPLVFGSACVVIP